MAYPFGTDAQGRGRFLLRTPDGKGELTAPFCGAHYAENLACVAAAAHELGLTRDEVIAGIQSMAADSQRFCCKVGSGVMVIDDTYNANPLSMTKSIRTAAILADGRPLVLVLGDMRELGEEAAMHHEELGRVIAGVEPAAILYRGELIETVSKGFGETIAPAGDAATFLDTWRKLGLKDAVVLFKGSRSLKMEELSNALCRELHAEVQGAHQ